MNPRSGRFAAWGLGVGLFAAALWFTPGLWASMDRWVQGQRDLAWSRLEAAVGQRIVYQRIAPTVLSALDFQNVRVLADDGTPVVTAASIRLSVDWGQILRGQPDLALRKIQVINAAVSLDSRRDQGLLDRWAGFFRSGSAGGTTPFGFEVEGFNLTLRWTDGTRSIGLDRGFVVLTPRENQWGLRYRGALSWEDRSAQGGGASLSVRGDLRADSSFRNLSVRTEVSQVRTSWFDLEPLTLQIVVSPETVTLAKVADRTPLDLQAVWDRAEDRWEFRGAAEGFRPSRLVRLKVDPTWSKLTEGTVSGRFEYRLGGDFTFSGQGSWPAGTWPAPLDRSAVSLSGRVLTESGLYRFEDFRLEGDLFSLGFGGDFDPVTWLPQGTLTLDRWTVPGTGAARGKVRMSRSGDRVDFVGEALGWNSLSSLSSAGWVEHRGKKWSFAVEGPWDATPSGRFALGGTWDSGPSRLSLEGSLSDLPLDRLTDEIRRWSPGFSWPETLGDLVVGAQASADWTAAGWSVPQAGFAVRDPGRPGRSAEGTLVWKEKRLRVDLSTLAWDGFQAGADVGVTFQDDGFIDFTVDAHAWERTMALAGRWSPGDRSLVFSGEPGISGVLQNTGAGGWQARVSLAPLPLVPGWSLGFRADATLDGAQWTLEADQIDLTGVYPWNAEAFSVQTKLSADERSIRLTDLTLTDSRGRLTGSAQTSWSRDFTDLWAGSLVFGAEGAGKEQLNLRWAAASATNWRLEGRAGGLDLTRVPSLGIQGRLALDGWVDVRAGALTWSAQAALSEARYGDAPLGFRAVLSGTDRRVEVRGANLAVSPVRITDGSLDWDSATRTWKADLGVGVRIGTGDWESKCSVTGSWSPEDQPFRARFALKSRDNSWSRRDFADWGLSGAWGDSGWDAALDDGGLTAQGGADGAFTIRAQAPFPVKGEAQGQWNDSQVSMSVRGFRADLTLLKDLINTDPFSVTAGEAVGEFLLKGGLSDPEVTGTLTVRGLGATSSFVRQSIGPVDVPVLLEGRQVRIPAVNIGPPGQTWMVSGLARLDHLFPEEFQLSVQTDALSVIPVSYQHTGVSVLGGVTGLFVIRGSPLAVTLGGTLVVQDSTITLKESKPGVGGGGPGFNVDLTLITGRKAEFLWPNESLPLLRAVAASNQVMVIKANDVASTWSVTGKMVLKTGEVNYLKRTFVIKEGFLGFQENQAGFDPRINVRAEWKTRETTGTTLVNLHADGLLSQFSPRFDAVPYKTPEELQQLVGTALALPTDYTKTTSVNTALSVASDVGTSFLMSPFEETVKKNFNLDLFTVKTEILKKTLLARNGPLEASDYLDNTRVFFGKYIGDDLFLQGTLAFRREDSATTQVSTEMVFEPELQMEFQTPFFLLNWTLAPQHPETLFVTDNTVTFRWDWSY